MSQKNNDISNKELLDAVSDSFDSMEERIDNLEQRLEKKIDDNREAIKNLDHKVDSLRDRLDAEILRYTDQHADHEKRITALEETVEV